MFINSVNELIYKVKLWQREGEEERQERNSGVVR